MSDNDSDNVVELETVSYLPIPVDQVLEEAKGKISAVVVVGYDEDNQLYMAASQPETAEALLLLQLGQRFLLEAVEAGMYGEEPPTRSA